MCTAFLCACSQGAEIAFDRGELDLCVGDSRDLFPYAMFTPSTAESKLFYLTADDECVTVTGTTVTAVAPGSAVVTAHTPVNSADIKINISYRAPVRMDIVASAETFNLDDIKSAPSATYSVALDDYIDPDIAVVWTVNGEEEGNGRTFSFTPQEFGEYDVCARAGDVTVAKKLTVYRKTEARILYTGELEQTRNYSPVSLLALEYADFRNPPSDYKWIVNGEEAGNGMIFSFMPHSAGEYRIECYVNGVRRAFPESDYLTVTVKGDRAPVGRVEYDDVGGIYIKWEGDDYIRSVSITSPSGETSVCARSDISNAYRFEKGSFNAEGLIDVCADNPGEYTIRLTGDSLGDAFKFKQLPMAAKQYREEKILCNNSLLTSAAQAKRWIYELYACGYREHTGYMTGTAEDIMFGIEAAASELGLDISVTVDGDTVKAALGEYINIPVMQSEQKRDHIFSESPHIAYNDNERRGESNNQLGYKLAIERAKETVEVSNTEQLVLAVTSGVRPVFASNRSDMSGMFNRAKSTLISIINKNSDDYGKVHAIYDWMQWCMCRTSVSPGYSCDFIDGMFGGSITQTGVLSSLGAAKCFALLCGMEGITCDITAQETEGEMYYFNSVKIDGLWYGVDVFGGKADVGAELTSHSRLLMCNATMKGYGLFCDHDCIDPGKAYYLQKGLYGGVYFDKYILPEEKNDYAQIKAIIFSSFYGDGGAEIIAPGVGGTIIRMKSTYGTEIALDEALSDEDCAAIKRLAIKAIAEFFVEARSAKLDETKVRIIDSEAGIQIIVPMAAVIKDE